MQTGDDRKTRRSASDDAPAAPLLGFTPQQLAIVVAVAATVGIVLPDTLIGGVGILLGCLLLVFGERWIALAADLGATLRRVAIFVGATLLGLVAPTLLLADRANAEELLAGLTIGAVLGLLMVPLLRRKARH